MTFFKPWATGGDWSKYKPSLAATEGANIGFAREAYEKGRGSSEPFENSGNVEATVTVPVQLMVDGDVFVEKTITAIADLTYRNNGKPLW